MDLGGLDLLRLGHLQHLQCQFDCVPVPACGFLFSLLFFLRGVRLSVWWWRRIRVGPAHDTDVDALKTGGGGGCHDSAGMLTSGTSPSVLVWGWYPRVRPAESVVTAPLASAYLFYMVASLA